MPTNKIGQIVEGMGARLEYRAKGSSIPSHIYIGTSAFCLLQLLCNVVCRFFFFPIQLIQSAFGIFINHILPLWKCDQGGRGTTYCDLLHAYAALFLLYLSQWKLIANYPNISMIIFQALL